jgi:hypothetical protein
MVTLKVVNVLMDGNRQLILRETYLSKPELVATTIEVRRIIPEDK